jgi:type VI secretion system protein
MLGPGRGGRGRRVVCATAISSARNLVAGGLLLLAFSATACSVTGKVRSAFGGQLPLRVTVEPGANDDSAIAVDFVVLYSDKLLDEVVKLPAAEWFSKRSRILADHPGELEVVQREWVPGQAVEPLSIPYHSGAKKIVVFADYHSGGEHRAVMPPQQASHVLLGETDLKVEAQP